jgi:hypothetical protein
MLDAHISGSKVGRALEELGHDVKATEKMERLPDDVLLELSAQEDRILITHNVKDFMQVLKQRPPEKPHAGVILIPRSIPHREFGAVISGIQRTLGDLSQEDWINRVEWMRKGE